MSTTAARLQFDHDAPDPVLGDPVDAGGPTLKSLTKHLTGKLTCIVAGHAWHVDMDPNRRVDAKFCIRCRARREL